MAARCCPVLCNLPYGSVGSCSQRFVDQRVSLICNKLAINCHCVAQVTSRRQLCYYRLMPWSWFKVLFGFVLAGHALTRLLAHWSVGVRSVMAFKSCSDWRRASHCKVRQQQYLPFAACCIEVNYVQRQLALQVLPGTFAGKKDIVELQQRAVVSFACNAMILQVYSRHALTIVAHTG